MVCGIGRDQSTNLLFNTSFRIFTILFKGSRAAGSKDSTYLFRGNSVCVAPGDYDCDTDRHPWIGYLVTGRYG